MDSEGPYFFGQIESMFSSGVITADALICEDGTDVWREIPDELEWQQQRKSQATLPPGPPKPVYVVAPPRKKNWPLRIVCCAAVLFLALIIGTGASNLSTDPSTPYLSSIQTTLATSTREWIKAKMEKARTIEVHDWQFAEKPDAHYLACRFTAIGDNGLEVPCKWYFKYAIGTNQLIYVIDIDHGVYIFGGEGEWARALSSP